MNFEVDNSNIVEILDSWSTLEGITDVGLLWSSLCKTGLADYISRVAALIVFICVIIGIVRQFVESGFMFNMRDYIAVFAKGVIVLFVFCILYYNDSWGGFSTYFAKFATAIHESFAEDSMKNFRAELRKLLFTMQTPSAESEVMSVFSSLRRAVGNLYVSLTRPMEALGACLMVVALQLLLMFLFLFMAVAPFFTLFALALGPISMALWVAFPQIGRAWGSLLIGSMFFAFVTTIGLSVIGNSGLLGLAANSLFMVRHAAVLLIVVLVLAYLVLVPFVLGQVFNCTAFNFMGRVLGWFYTLTVYLAPLSIMSEAMSIMVGGSYKKGKIFK